MRTRLALLMAAGLAAAAPAAAQNPTPAPAAPPLEVGAVAPDFTMPGATRYGILRDDIKLSDFKGRTVVMSFFFRARTRG